MTVSSRPRPLERVRWVSLDVGETLIDETRVWGAWADELAIPRLTFFAALGAVIERGLDYAAVFELLGAHDWRDRIESVEARYGGFAPIDLYPDAIRTLRALRADGYRTAILANQPARRRAQLLALGLQPDVIAMSEELGAAKPDPVFFERALQLMDRPVPAEVAYVGDRLDNDAGPAHAAGMLAVWIRRGPWGRIPRPSDRQPADLVVDSLDELVQRLREASVRGGAGPR